VTRDARTIPEGERIETGLCIVGAGAAGLAIAHAFANTAHRVTLLESGSFEFDRDTQALYGGKNVGLPYFPLDTARLRFFGGTTNHWGGYCNPFEDIDFAARAGVPNTGWPISRADIAPYYPEAETFCGITTREWSNAYWEPREDVPPLHFEDGRVDNRVIQIVPSTRRHLGSVHRDEVTGAANVDTILNANVTQIVTNEAGRKVTHLEVATLAGNTFRVAADEFVLAAGGIENARLLLVSNRREPAGLGNRSGLVGRYFMDHPRFAAARIHPTSGALDLRFYETHDVSDVQLKGHLALARKVLEEEQLVDVQMRLSPIYDPKTVRVLRSRGGTSLIYVLKSLSHGQAPDEFAKHLSRIVFDIEEIPGFVIAKSFRDRLPVTHVDLVTRMNPAPNPDSRVRLSATERDALGVPRVELDWQLSSIDRHSAIRAAEIVGEELGKSGLGRLQLLIDENGREWPADTEGGFHHVGTTRMSDDPKTGVVDSGGRVHGIANLNVAGSSVFCTAGSGSPTMTIVALALRMAQGLKTRMASS